MSLSRQEIELLAASITNKLLEQRNSARPAQTSAASSATSGSADAAVLARQLASALNLSARNAPGQSAAAQAVSPMAARQFLGRIMPSVEHVLVYENIELQDLAREKIPIDALHEEAHARHMADPNTDFQNHLMRATMKWFKGSFFVWVNEPPCDGCGGKTNGIGAAQPTQEDLRHGASRVELYSCSGCGKHTRFPRYNDPAKLLETRRGRCGEWANVFCLVCRTLGFDTRYVLDFTDHVWTEVYSEKQKRWIHCDSCEGEGAYDTPLLYETGWGKKLDYVISIGANDVVDVTRRYTKDMNAVLARRNLVPETWITSTLASITAQRRAMLSSDLKLELSRRDLSEQEDLAREHSKPEASGTSSALPGRQSGAVEWREARGELGDQKK